MIVDIIKIDELLLGRHKGWVRPAYAEMRLLISRLRLARTVVNPACRGCGARVRTVVNPAYV